jgi:putative transposase
MEKKSFYFELIKPGTVIRIRHGETLLGENGVLTPILTEFLKGALEIGLEPDSGAEEEASRKNRIGALRGKLNRQLTALHARSGSYSDLRSHLGVIYHRESSASNIRKVFGKHKCRAANNKRKIR